MDYIRKQGFKWKREHVIIGDMPVQFIAAGQLEKEAIANARDASYEQVETRIISPEYLIALFLKAGRGKDLIRVKLLLEQARVDKMKLASILHKYGLKEQ